MTLKDRLLFQEGSWRRDQAALWWDPKGLAVGGGRKGEDTLEAHVCNREQQPALPGQR